MRDRPKATERALNAFGSVVRTSRRRNRSLKIAILLGADAEPIPEIQYPPSVFSPSSSIALGTRRADAKLWTNYEYARFFTSNACPGFTYFAIYHLIRERLVGSVITTNYDQFFNSLDMKLGLNLSINPIPRPPQNSSYYHHGRKRGVTLWKIHGSLSHVLFRGCTGGIPHVFPVPSFIMGFNTITVQQKYKLRVLHDYLGWNSDDASYCNEIDTGYYVHYTDNAFAKHGAATDRRSFRQEIAGAIGDIQRADAVLSIGFRCGLDEEIAPALATHASRGSLYFFISEDQMKSSLWRSGKQRRISRTREIARKGGRFLRAMLPRDAPSMRKRNRNRIGFFLPADRDGFAAALLDEAGFDSHALYAEYLCDWVNGRTFMDGSRLLRAT